MGHAAEAVQSYYKRSCALAYTDESDEDIYANAYQNVENLEEEEEEKEEEEELKRPDVEPHQKHREDASERSFQQLLRKTLPKVADSVLQDYFASFAQHGYNDIPGY